MSLCKLRQCFSVVALMIVGSLGADTLVLQTYRTNNIIGDVLSCFENDKCVCSSKASIDHIFRYHN